MYARIAQKSLFLSRDYGSLSNNTLFLTGGYFDETTLRITPIITLGGIKMSKLERNRSMFFGSWTGQPIPEEAKANIGDSTGVKSCTVTAATFGTAVNGKGGEYVFTYEDGSWVLNGSKIDATTTYGMSVTGEPAKNDIIVVVYTPATNGWEAIGKDNDDLSKELNPDTETSKNVLGESSFKHSGYEPEVGVDPYYMDPGRKMYERMLKNAMEENYAESDLLGWFAEAFFQTANKNTGKMTGYALIRQAYFVPQSVGGDTSGFAIPYTIHPIGATTRKKVVYDIATNEATFTDED